MALRFSGRLRFPSIFLISFAVVQEDLLKICIADPDYIPSHVSEPIANGTATPAILSSDTATTEARRRLLATGSTENACPDGKRSLWESDLIHKVHVLAFVIAGAAPHCTSTTHNHPGCLCVLTCCCYYDMFRHQL